MAEEIVYGEEKQEQEEERIVCKGCGSPSVEEGYMLPLCEGCRNSLAGRSFPLWIKLVLGVLTILMAVAFYKFPQSLKAGIDYEKGNAAATEKKYLTASNLFNQVLDQYPESGAVLSKVYEAYYYSGQIEAANPILQRIIDANPNDNKIVDAVNYITDQIDTFYYPSQKFAAVLQNNQDKKSPELMNEIKSFIDENPNEVLAVYYYANHLFEEEKYEEAERLMLPIMEIHPDFDYGRLFMAAIYRELGEFETAVAYCNKALESNVESPQAYTALAKVELKRHQDEKGLELARKALELAPSDSHCMANVALAYHYKGMTAERDAMFEQFKKCNDGNDTDLEFLTSVFNGNLQWR